MSDKSTNKKNQLSEEICSLATKADLAIPLFASLAGQFELTSKQLRKKVVDAELEGCFTNETLESIAGVADEMERQSELLSALASAIYDTTERFSQAINSEFEDED